MDGSVLKESNTLREQKRDGESEIDGEAEKRGIESPLERLDEKSLLLWS